jgi:hypothetical protein
LASMRVNWRMASYTLASTSTVFSYRIESLPGAGNRGPGGQGASSSTGSKRSHWAPRIPLQLAAAWVAALGCPAVVKPRAAPLVPHPGSRT